MSKSRKSTKDKLPNNWLASFFSEGEKHPEVEDVYDYFLNRDNLSKDKIVSLSDHFATCKRCAAEAEKTQKIVSTSKLQSIEHHLK